jgi:predicted RNA polymerase sigma factor
MAADPDGKLRDKIDSICRAGSRRVRAMLICLLGDLAEDALPDACTAVAAQLGERT